MQISLRFLCTAVMVAAMALTGCSRPPDLVGIDNPEVPAASVPDVSRHRMFIMTTRQATEVVGAFFSARRAPELGLASVDVTVPPIHVTGQLERAKRLPPDPRKEFAVIDPAIYSTDAAFIAAVDRELSRRPPGQRRLLLFIHGYNNTTSDAILRLTQFVEDTGFQGVPVLFSWASAARTPRYVYDLNSALVARVKLKELASILGRTKADGMDIFAHSMGTFLTMEGLVDAQQAGTLNRRGRIDSIMLASPDIDIDLFRTQVGLLPPAILRKMYLLVSRDDSALRFSRIIAGGVPRVGAADAAELEQLGVTVIDLSKIDDSSSGSHSKFAGSPEVVQLIGAGLNAAGRFGDAESPALHELIAGAPIRILGN
ncbi:alpha/beta hydrolase [Cereibacter sphaeroides]|uniref:alpha/beta hydrolase n=1 Tax=Cereibacter sphaeroides TaxID=1063 RepID=UPI001F1EB7C0|nr:alpha/beta hydrolase [Cereibacter sphaeroides]MCE6967934.1 alpha/beta hydrolase [Cereibacter sphaeroides]